MSDKHKEKILPIEWVGWDEIDVNSYCFYDVTFTEDFGLFKKDENYTDIMVDNQNGILEAYKNGEVVVSQKFKCIPIFDIE